jgi:hypothetical protein
MPAVTCSGGFQTTATTSVTQRTLSVTAASGDAIIVATNVSPTSVAYDNGGTVTAITNMANGGNAGYGVVYLYKILSVSGTGTVTVNAANSAIKIAAATYQNVSAVSASSGLAYQSGNPSTVSVTASSIPTDGAMVAVFGCYSLGIASTSSGSTLRQSAGFTPVIADYLGAASSRNITATCQTFTSASGVAVVLNPTASSVPTNQFFAVF